MDRLGKLLIAVDAEALTRIEAELAEIKKLLQRSTISPAPDWVSVSFGIIALKRPLKPAPQRIGWQGYGVRIWRASQGMTICQQP